ncbi:MAG: hypothetical protein JWM11_5697 [Planctomycetaceae bacterium]|nr:hypothetical protein [Planctomycetaceae bacterium]
MKCDEVWSQLETGSPVGRWRARRHLARCPHCTAEMQAWNNYKDRLQSPEPLTAEQRSAWMQPAEVPESETVVMRSRPVNNHDARLKRGRMLLVTGAVCVAVSCLTIAVWPRGKPVEDPQFRAETVTRTDNTRPKHVIQEQQRDKDSNLRKGVLRTVAVQVKLSDELERLDAEILDSLQEIEILKQRLKRLAVRQKIDALLAQHRRW